MLSFANECRRKSENIIKLAVFKYSSQQRNALSFYPQPEIGFGIPLSRRRAARG